MELSEAIEALRGLIEPQSYTLGSYDKEAVAIVLKELHTLQMNYKLLEEKFDGSAEEKVDKLTEELEKQKQIKAEMRKVAFEEGYNQGYLAGAMERI